MYNVPANVVLFLLDRPDIPLNLVSEPLVHLFHDPEKVDIEECRIKLGHCVLLQDTNIQAVISDL
jgi:hypothetical protein